MNRNYWNDINDRFTSFEKALEKTIEWQKNNI